MSVATGNQEVHVDKIFRHALIKIPNANEIHQKSNKYTGV